MIEPYYKDEYTTLYCGKCEDVLPQLPEQSVGMVFTSPPYNMRTRIRNGEYTERERSEHFSKKYQHFHDALPIEEYYEFHGAMVREMLRVAPLAFVNIQIVTGSKEAWFRLIGDFNKHIKDVIVWDKGEGQPAMHGDVINRSYELILAMEANTTAGRAFSKKYFERGTMPDVWRFGRGGDGSANGHAATYPVELAAKAMLGWTRADETVLDPFCGTGTTLVAAKRFGRKAVGIELCEDYCQIAVDRLRQHELFVNENGHGV